MHDSRAHALENELDFLAFCCLKAKVLTSIAIYRCDRAAYGGENLAMRFFRLFFAVLTIIFILVCYFMWVTEVSNWKVGDELYLDAGSSELFNNYTEDSESSAWGGHVDRHVESYLQLGQSTALVEPALKGIVLLSLMDVSLADTAAITNSTFQMTMLPQTTC